MQSKQSKIDDLNFELGIAANEITELKEKIFNLKRDYSESHTKYVNELNDGRFNVLSNIEKCNNIKNMFIGILWSFKYQFEVIQSEGATHRHKAFMCNCAKVNCDATIKSLEKESFIGEDLPF